MPKSKSTKGTKSTRKAKSKKGGKRGGAKNYFAGTPGNRVFWDVAGRSRDFSDNMNKKPFWRFIDRVGRFFGLDK